ncbi:hypothetical protein PIB30_057383 [Stylosanthes scabra]|uniref:Uncharacterized protein n=1 Tax=Stylosanthes scabra TaxID=79078 RepID=A0ABU6RJM6_9FABA|nr:hypothetical protein [Stylosanthes scabra]
MRTAMDCAWMLDGATKDRMYALSLASRIDSSSSESILKRRNMVSKGFQRLSDDDWSGYISCKLIPLFYKIRTMSLGIKRGRKGYRLGLWQQRTIGSSKCLWGSCFHMGQELTSRLTVAAGGSPASVPANNLGISH